MFLAPLFLAQPIFTFSCRATLYLIFCVCLSVCWSQILVPELYYIIEFIVPYLHCEPYNTMILNWMGKGQEAANAIFTELDLMQNFFSNTEEVLSAISYRQELYWLPLLRRLEKSHIDGSCTGIPFSRRDPFSEDSIIFHMRSIC